MSLQRNLVFFISSVALTCASVRAVTLDWDTATWTDGATSGTPTTGVDVNVTASAPNLFQPSLVSPNPATPAITRAFDGGLVPGQNSFEIAIDLPNNGNANTVTITLTFNPATYAGGVSNVSFTIFDIDYDNISGSTYQDKVSNITATAVGGGSVTPTISNLGSAVTDTNGVLTGNVSVVDTGTGSNGGNATISFGATPLSSISFTYGSGGLFANPTYQHIGVSDVTFTPVPEINPAWAAALSCVAAGFLILRHNARFRK